MSNQLSNESEILVDRKSKFQARCCELNDQNSISLLLDTLVQSNKSVAKASHRHMYAWRTGQRQDVKMTNELNSIKKNKKKSSKVSNNENNIDVKSQYTNIQQGCFDGGEAGAGQRLLTLLERSNAINVLVIVTRWYGGIPLGSARFRHISSTAVESLKRGKFIS